jgi:hypothetical protein
VGKTPIKNSTKIINKIVPNDISSLPLTRFCYNPRLLKKSHNAKSIFSIY